VRSLLSTITHLLLRLVVKEFWKSVGIWSIGLECSGVFYDSRWNDQVFFCPLYYEDVPAPEDRTAFAWNDQTSTLQQLLSVCLSVSHFQDKMTWSIIAMLCVLHCIHISAVRYLETNQVSSSQLHVSTTPLLFHLDTVPTTLNSCQKSLTDSTYISADDICV